jgi:hypothetical protein
MKNIDDYPELTRLVGAYLGEDYSYWGDNIEEIISSYRRDATKEICAKVVAELERFERENSDNFENAFEAAYCFSFSPQLMGYTISSFVRRLKELLQE